MYNFVLILVIALQDIMFNLLASGISSSNLESINFKPILQNSNLGTRCDIYLRWMSLNFFTNEKSTLVHGLVSMQQAVTWTNIDPDICHHMAPLGYNGLTQIILIWKW